MLMGLVQVAGVMSKGSRPRRTYPPGKAMDRSRAREQTKNQTACHQEEFWHRVDSSGAPGPAFPPRGRTATFRLLPRPYDEGVINALGVPVGVCASENANPL